MIHYFIAKKYIFSFKNLHFISIITFLSIIGIIIGVAALIIVVSIFNGFRELNEKMLVGFDPHIRIQSSNNSFIADTNKVFKILRNINGINAVSYSIQTRVIIIKASNVSTAINNLVNINEINSVSGLSNSIILGKFNLSKNNDIDQIVIGAGLADRLGVFVGDTLKILSPNTIESAIISFNQNIGNNVIISGIFQTSAKEFSQSYIYSNINSSNNYFENNKNNIGFIDIRANDFERIEEIINQINKELINYKSEYSIISWQDLHKDLFTAMKFERLASFIILGLIISIAVFNVFVALSMTVIEKKSDIAILKTIGASHLLIKRIFLTQGIIIALISSFIGTIIGLFFCWGQNYYHWFQLDTSKYIIDAMPISVYSLDVIVIACFAVFSTILAALYPAYKAVGLDIISSVREE